MKFRLAAAVSSCRLGHEHGNWKYRIEGTDIEGDDLITILVIFDVDLSLLNLTVF